MVGNTNLKAETLNTIDIVISNFLAKIKLNLNNWACLNETQSRHSYSLIKELKSVRYWEHHTHFSYKYTKMIITDKKLLKIIYVVRILTTL